MQGIPKIMHVQYSYMDVCYILQSVAVLLLHSLFTSYVMHNYTEED